MNRKELLLNEISCFNLPAYNEIPNVGLFLEQVTKYITEYMQPVESVSLTGSMISNYVKKKIVRNPIRKQYDRNQIAVLIFIAMAKTVLTLEDIQLMLQMIPEDVTPAAAYEAFRTDMMNTLHLVFEDEGAAQADEDDGMNDADYADGADHTGDAAGADHAGDAAGADHAGGAGHTDDAAGADHAGDAVHVDYAAGADGEAEGDDEAEKKRNAVIEEKLLLKHTVITIAHKIYMDKYFKAVRNQ